MQLQVDIWTSNDHQKRQLAEQILTIMYPDFQIQNSDNPLDWAARTTVYMDDAINWTSRSVPIGTGDDIEVLTINLTVPIWLNPPAKVKQQRVIEQIVLNVDAVSRGADMDDASVFTGGTRLFTDITTPGNHWVNVSGNRITLLGRETASTDVGGDPYPWQDLIEVYGFLNPTVSQIRLKQNPDLDRTDTDIVGYIQYDPMDTSKLIFTVDPDTLPGNTLTPINAVIDPLRSWPGNNLPAAAEGQRYLIISDIGTPSQIWGALAARSNDIIQYQGGQWVRAFNANTPTPPPTQYVLNQTTGRQLRFTGYDWVLTIDGKYPPGMWRLAHLYKDNPGDLNPTPPVLEP
jgi:hypothetical protein